MMRFGLVRLWLLGLSGVAATMAQAAEHVTLKNGFAIDCSRREVVGDHVRLYMVGSNIGSESYLEVAAGAVVRVETIPDLPEAAPIVVKTGPVVAGAPGLTLTREEMHTMLSHAGMEHNIDEDLLASVVRAESGGQVRAVSRTGAQGLMQLMPGTATELGVGNAFQPEENIGGGTAYLDQLLKRYNDNVALALAAYNAGPAAVDRYHGIPPYRETRTYVARVVREFNRRKQAARVGEQVAQAK